MSNLIEGKSTCWGDTHEVGGGGGGREYVRQLQTHQAINLF